jgi:Protein of unknown function (DUF5663)
MDTHSKTDFKAITDALEFDEMTPEEQEELMLDLGNLIYNGTMLRIMERMDEKYKDDFHALIDKNAPEEELAEFIEKHVPNADAAVEETVAELTRDILAVTKG